ncbi:hypothetical protein AAZX31_18G272600 [Glycine max]|uniref:Knottin scorpion toxin-like domain-containing protein n=2 Tax=Glycine subgen. Soja TaxID=1462606 RepID=I1N573_SOYBN|nr:hypothetical protein JHK86_051749 [Glycine max]KAG4926106.1 hypothetical protein JHK87_051646 [Glycine soja]KAG4937686.1 hypothetical protein JHK85_052605 [Glycine max]KAG5093135.1 hypothetical protein JHK82_051913 [Glycine max]KAG5096202.1 hypothetical protein JHK84_051790 [Glycine max]
MAFCFHQRFLLEILIVALILSSGTTTGQAFKCIGKCYRPLDCRDYCSSLGFKKFYGCILIARLCCCSD